MKETEASWTWRSAALSTRNRVSERISISIATEPENLQRQRSGLRLISYRFGTANFGSRGWPLNRSIDGETWKNLKIEEENPNTLKLNKMNGLLYNIELAGIKSQLYCILKKAISFWDVGFISLPAGFDFQILHFCFFNPLKLIHCLILYLST